MLTERIQLTDYTSEFDGIDVSFKVVILLAPGSRSVVSR